MLALDLCCGRGGWAHGLIAEGWEVVGVDLADFANVYPGRFIKADLMDWPCDASPAPFLVNESQVKRRSKKRMKNMLKIGLALCLAVMLSGCGRGGWHFHHW